MNPFTAILRSLRSLRTSVQTLPEMKNQFNEFRNEFAAELSFSINDVRQHLADTRAIVDETHQKILELTNTVAIVEEVGLGTQESRRRLEELVDSLAVVTLPLGRIEARLGLLESLETRLDYNQNQLVKENRSVRERLDRLDNLATHLDTSLGSRLNRLENTQLEAKNVIAGMSNLVTHLNTSLASRLNRVDNIEFESKNLISHLHTSVHTRLDKIQNETMEYFYDQMHEIAAAQFGMRARMESNRAWASHLEELYKPAKPEAFSNYLRRAERDFSIVYEPWKERLDATLKALRQTKVGNAAHAGDPRSRLFRSFVELYAGGRVLDVGCGIFGRPYYLDFYPTELIAGLDPLTPTEAPDFEFVRGISEYLPWPDASFSTVISATSLDHSLSLKRSLAELGRVLRPGGHFLLWIASVPGSPKYEPEDPAFVPADEFHLFHFDVVWFEPLINASFETIDRVELRKPKFSEIMYCLRKSES
jgi:SAM-dependent methyltransferase